MDRNRTPDEVVNEYVQKMGKELGSVFSKLWNEMGWLCEKWLEYCALYATKPSRITLMKEAAPAFFTVVQHTLWENILLHIARLTDPEKTYNKTNLTIQCLPSLVTDQQMKDNVKQLVDVALAKTEFCRDWRNRHIAHKDFDLAMKQGAQPLKPANREKVKEAIDAISEVLNCIESHYMNSRTLSGEVIYTGGVVDLIYVIDDGLRFDKAQKGGCPSRECILNDRRVRNL